MDENLVGYALNSLDPATHEQVEARLRSDPDTQRRLELVRQALAPLDDDRHVPAAPDLVHRTLARVAEHCCRELPRLPTAPRREPLGPSTPFWRRADVLIAASLLLMAFTLAVPAVARWREYQNRVECQRNLSDYHKALTNYRNIHQRMPNAYAKGPPYNVAGMIAPTLSDARVLPATAGLCCPASSGCNPCSMTLAQLHSMPPAQFQQQAPALIHCYAHSLGYRDENGVFRTFDPVHDHCASSAVPFMSDRPPSNLFGNSPNHRGQGQNVLFYDGHVEFTTQRTFGPEQDDIFLNRNNEVGAGIGSSDFVLGSSAARPY